MHKRIITLIGATLAAGLLWAQPAHAQGCGPQNPNCIVPTAPAGTSTNQAASTKFVQNALTTALPLPSGDIFIGSVGNVATAQAPSGDLSLSLAGAFTLKTVNSNVGSFGSATQCVAITTNGKGLITAASAVTCTPAIASITGLGTGIAAALAVNANASGGICVLNPTRAGDIMYWNGSACVTLAGNNSGTGFLSETNLGVPSWVAAPGTGTVTSVTCGTGLSGGTFTTTGTCALLLTNATLVGSPTNPTGTTSATGLMMGLGVSTCRITTTYSTRLDVTIDGSILNSSVGGISGINVRFGTGAGPANAAAPTGTVVGNTTSYGNGGAVFQAGFSKHVIITGLSAATTYWIDILVSASAGTSTPAGLTCSAMEF